MKKQVKSNNGFIKSLVVIAVIIAGVIGFASWTSSNVIKTDEQKAVEHYMNTDTELYLTAVATQVGKITTTYEMTSWQAKPVDVIHEFDLQNEYMKRLDAEYAMECGLETLNNPQIYVYKFTETFTRKFLLTKDEIKEDKVCYAYVTTNGKVLYVDKNMGKRYHRLSADELRSRL
jgi:type II secretory pathway pseudopilin PulG